MKLLYEFGRFTLDVEESRLLRDGQPVPLKPKVLETLLVLVENGAHVLAKEELMARLWPDSFVEEANLAVNISQLRKALGEDENGERYIETVPKRGYRFAAQVTKVLANPVDLVVREHTKSRIVVEEQEIFADDRSLAGGTESLSVASTSAGALPARSTLVQSLVVAAKQHKALTVIALGCIAIAVASASFAIRWLVRPKPQNGSREMLITRLTWTGNVKRAAISPDGKYVVYATLDSGQESLWITNVATRSNVRVIEPHDVFYEALVFSPDGNYIYFNRREDGQRAVYEVPVFGAPARKFARDPAGHVAVSPDGKQVTFVREDRSVGNTNLIVANVDGSGERTVATRKAPDFFFSYPDGLAWSPDGRVIACRAGSTDPNGFYRNVVGVRVDDGTETPISSRGWKWIGGIAWLHDGDGLLITASEQQQGDQVQQVWRLSYPGGEAHKITNDLSGYLGMSLATDSATMLTLQLSVFSSIWVASSADPTKGRQITRGTYEGGTGVSWAPDGRIVYSSRSGGTDQIWIMDAEGSNQKQLTTVPAMNGGATVTGDSRYIVFHSFDAGTLNVNIWRIDIDGGNPKQLSSGNNDVWPQCSPDSKWVVYTRHDSPTSYTTWKVPIDGGESLALTEQASANATVSPDGRLVACVEWDHDSQKVAIVPFAGGSPLELFDVPADIRYASLRWIADGGAVSYSNVAGSKVWIQPLTGGPAGELVDVQDRIWYFDWSRDGKQLAIARGKATSDVVMISNFR